jgi:hypothetical protein
MRRRSAEREPGEDSTSGAGSLTSTWRADQSAHPPKGAKTKMTTKADVRKPRLLSAILTLGALGAAPTSASAVDAPSVAEQWRVANETKVQTGVEYQLHNSKGGQLGYKKRTFGADVGFVGSSGGHFKLMRKAPPNVRDHRRRVVEDELVALYNSKHRQYLINGSPVFGVSLGWSRTPVYEWRLRDIDGVKFALFNTRKGDYLVHGYQTLGPNLWWLKNLHPTIDTSPKQASVALSAQPVVRGFVPMLGKFGGGLDRGKITSIQNASTSATLMFVKPGKSTTNCGDPDATVRIAPRAIMTPTR